MDTTPKPQGGINKKMIWIALGTLTTGLLSLFGYKALQSKKQTNEKNNQDEKQSPENNPDLHSQKPAVADKNRLQNNAGAKPDTRLPAGGDGAAFPLASGARGQTVRELQLALIRRYGAGILGPAGADGIFGQGLTAALRSKGYTVPLAQEDYKKIVAPDTVVSFNPAASAYSLADAIGHKDYNSAILLLKGIANTENYKALSERFQTFRINGVRQTPVNAMFEVFDERSQKENTRQVLLSIGLKYDSDRDRWSLSGVQQGPGTLITNRECLVILGGSDGRTGMRIPAGVAIGQEIMRRNGKVYFHLFDGSRSFYVNEQAVNLAPATKPLGKPESIIKEGDKVLASETLLATNTKDQFVLIPKGVKVGMVRYNINGICHVDVGTGARLFVREDQLEKQRSRNAN